MKTLLSVLVAAAFAATGLNAVAQSKDVTTKSGTVAKSKDGTAVKTKDVKDLPKNPAPKMAQPPKKEKPAATEVKTKSGGPVKTKDGKDVSSKK